MVVELLSVAQLVEQAKEEVRIPFGEIPVIEPPPLLLEVQRVAAGEGYGFFAPIYFPLGEIRLNELSPEGWVKPETWFFEQLGKGLKPEVARIGAFWALFDESRRPDYQSGTQLFENDQRLGEMLAGLRQTGKITIRNDVRHVPKISRFAVSTDEQDRAVFPQLARHLRLVDQIATQSVKVRRPKASEFNYAGNLRYPHLGEANTCEGFEDHFKDKCRLIGGGSYYGGLAYVDYKWTDSHRDFISFRPVVEFSSQTQDLITW